jgi:hypothetical protein
MDQHEVYLEIGGGGVKFEVVSDFRGRPLLVVEATHYGQKTNTLQLLTNSEALAKLGEMFTAASKEDFPGVEYVYAAKVYEPSELTGNAESCGPETCA